MNSYAELATITSRIRLQVISLYHIRVCISLLCWRHTQRRCDATRLHELALRGSWWLLLHAFSVLVCTACVAAAKPSSALQLCSAPLLQSMLSLNDLWSPCEISVAWFYQSQAQPESNYVSVRRASTYETNKLSAMPIVLELKYANKYSSIYRIVWFWSKGQLFTLIHLD